VQQALMARWNRGHELQREGSICCPHVGDHGREWTGEWKMGEKGLFGREREPWWSCRIGRNRQEGRRE
jgi:hypothetical protein